ncbi:MAG TPA: hydrogenase maturation nickel metallochaperone HypA, partial [Roseiarcus sp.]|nr:hydrogenase maturation nickel metallochaperone HypA [Roseiarcus sp.]
CFDVVTAGTALEGASLEIHKIEGRARCESCAAEFATATLFAACACGSGRLTRLQGEELNVKSMELMEAA